MNKNKVLVVGGAGYIGGLNCDILKKNGFDVTVYDNLLYEERFLKKINFIFGDIRDTEFLIQVSENFDVIILMAALVGDPACSVDINLTEEINYLSIKRFCEKIKENKHIIFISTCSVYGAQNEILNEESLTNPLSAYASTKLKSEEYILKKNGCVFRLGTVFGVGDDFSRIRLDLVVNILALKAFSEKEIHINGGDQWRPIISVEDVANYIFEECVFRRGGLYILANENVKISELGNRICKVIPDTKVNYNQISFQDARNYKVDNSKSLRIFDYKPRVSVEMEVGKLLKIFRENRITNLKNSVYNNGFFIQKKRNENKL